MFKYLYFGLLVIFVFAFTACQPVSVTKPTDNKAGEEMADHSMISEHEQMITSDQEFLEMMIPHHQEAVEASKVLLAKTENAELKKFLEGVIEVQTAEITQMKNWYKSWFGQDYQSKEEYIAMMPDLSKLEERAADEAYIRGMILHHQGAIAMARDLQGFTKRSELLDLAKAVIEVQSAEIDLLNSYLHN